MTETFYRAVSAVPGERDWAAVRRLYHPEARLVRTGLNPDGSAFAKAMSLDAYIENVGQLLKDVRFSEVEVGHDAEVFGNVAFDDDNPHFAARFHDSNPGNVVAKVLNKHDVSFGEDGFSITLDPFEISDGVVIPGGTYNDDHACMTLYTGEQRVLATDSTSY
jgi:hypothetical protein